MAEKNVKETGERIFALIDERYGSDAAFERSANLLPKTVNNWKRGRSASYMKMLPELASLFGVSPASLMGEEDGALSQEEEELLTLFRATKSLSPSERAALSETLQKTIGLYLSSRGQEDKT